MRLTHGAHLAYCTNVHPGETWKQTFDSLNRWTLQVKSRLGHPEPYAIGLRLSDLAARELSDPVRLRDFQRWLEHHSCYVFTINGFPFGRFHGGRVKEQVYVPDWTTPERLDYTNLLFDILAELLPPGLEGSVSTLPGSFKEFIKDPNEVQVVRDNLWRCVEHISKLAARSGHNLHLGLEPEPLGLFENSIESVEFFDRVREQHPNDERLDLHLGVNYDTCHFAVEFESPSVAINRLRQHKVLISKIHLSNALSLRPSPAALKQLALFTDDVYLHQVIVGDRTGVQKRYRDLPQALGQFSGQASDSEEWRVHFHVPLHCQSPLGFDSTSDHVLGLLQTLKNGPDLCRHFEMETYTWAVLPEELRSRDVSAQLVDEYQWTLAQLAQAGFCRLSPSKA